MTDHHPWCRTGSGLTTASTSTARSLRVPTSPPPDQVQGGNAQKQWDAGGQFQRQTAPLTVFWVLDLDRRVEHGVLELLVERDHDRATFTHNKSPCDNPHTRGAARASISIAEALDFLVNVFL